MADALTRRGLRVAMVGRSEAVLPTVDASLGRIVQQELGKNLVETTSDVSVEAISEIEHGLSVTGTATQH